MNVTFDNPPSLHLLQQLAKGSLDQNHHFSRALRLWVLLRWLYSDNGYAALSKCFTYGDWRKAFFCETHQDEKQEDILKHHEPDCACHKTTSQWLAELEVPLDEWQNSLQGKTSISHSNLDELLQERLFAQVRKSLQSDFDLLASRNWLQRAPTAVGRSKQYCRVEILPILNQSKKLDNNLTPKKQAYVAGALGMFSFLDPKYPLLAEEMADDIDEDNHRVFLYVDYVVPESSPIQDTVDELQSELQEIWDSGKVLPLLLTYHSAHQNQVKECVVYPVCIYFMERAKYLCAYGSTPKGEINWYKYRLDRIISKRLVPLNWEDPRVPQLLREKYEDDQLPTPKTVNDKLKQAWGCDFYKEQALMILRFNKDFHQRYIQGISIHETFTSLDYEHVKRLIKQHTSNLQQQQILLELLQSRPMTDAYYQVYYRDTDYYVIRWLRALGSNLEVLLPWHLRQEMALEIQNTWNLYQSQIETF